MTGVFYIGFLLIELLSVIFVLNYFQTSSNLIIFVQIFAPMKKKIDITRKEEQRRHKRLTCLVSEREDEIINNYLERFNIKNKSTWIRETILHFVYDRTESNYPTLFNDHEMRR